MSAPSVTYTFTNGTTADATQVNTNFTDLINAMSDGTRDFTIGSLIVNGAVTLKGTVTLGDSTADDITITGSIAATIPFKTNATYNIGSSTLAPLSIYLGNGTKSTRIMAGTVGTSYTITLPNDAPTTTGMYPVFDTNATMSFRYPDKITAVKTTTYTATGDERVIPVSAASGSWTLTLPAAASYTNKSFKIIRTDDTIANQVTIDGNGSETINGATTYLLYTQYESVTIVSDGSNWYKTESYTRTPWVDAGAITITATTSNPTKGTTQQVDKFWWSRNGNLALCRYEFLQTSGAGGAAGTGDYLFTMPTGLTIETNVISVYTTVEGAGSYVTRNALGSGSITDATAVGVVFATVYDSTRFRIFGTSATQGFAIGSAAAPLNAQANYVLDFAVPISGWNG